MNTRYVMAETTSDNLFKFKNKPRQDIQLIELKNSIIIGISSETNSLNIYAPDENEIYDYIGDIALELNNIDVAVRLFSLGMSSISFDSNVVPIPEKVHPITVLSGTIDTKKCKTLVSKEFNLNG